MIFEEHAPREARDGDAVAHLESRTRSRVLHVVSADGPITAVELGRNLDLTPAAVRRHLDLLVEQGAVVPHEPVGGRRGRGRPARAFVVSEAGHRVLEADYDSLAVEVLRFLQERAGSSAVADFARERCAAVEARYAARLDAVGDDPAARADVLVEALSEDGFAATARPVGSGGLAGIQLCQGHCPVQHVAEEFPAFCEAETDTFSRLLGVHVQRLATLAGGHHVCTTFVPTAGVARKTRGPGGVAPESLGDVGETGRAARMATTPTKATLTKTMTKSTSSRTTKSTTKTARNDRPHVKEGSS